MDLDPEHLSCIYISIRGHSANNDLTDQVGIHREVNPLVFHKESSKRCFVPGTSELGHSR